MHQVTIKPEWIIRRDGGEPLPRRLVDLLVQVHDLGSLAAACKATGLSYRYAWDLLRQGEKVFGEPLLVMARGKGSTLTLLGEKLVWAERRIVARLSPLLASLASELGAEIEKARSPAAGRLRMHASHGFSIQLLHQWLGEAGVPTELKYVSSLEAVVALHKGECDVAGFHIPAGAHEAAVLDHYAQWLRPRSLRIISSVSRRQGLMVAPGNPKSISRPGDLARPGVRFINRQPGSGTRLLLELLLRDDGVDPSRIHGWEQCEYTHAAVAAYVASGMADVGYGVETPARQFKLEFIPGQTERYCLVCHEKALATPALQQVLALLRSARYKTAVNALPGYKAGRTGVVQTLDEAFGPRSRTPAARKPVKRTATTRRAATAAN